MQKFTYLDYLKYTKEINKNIKISDVSEEYKLEKIHQPQDKCYKIVFDKKEEVASFINKALKLKNTQYELKQEEIEIYNTNFITVNYKEKRADIVYRKKDEDIFFLIEHQSAIDYEMPIVYPIVLCTGKRRWNINSNFENYKLGLKRAHRVTFTGYNLVDINDYTEEELWKENTLLSKMLLLEKAKKQKNITQYLERIIKQELTKEEMRLLMEMIYNAKDIDFEEIKQIVEKLKNEKGDEVTMLTPLQEYVEDLNRRERKEGFETGKIEGEKTKLKKVVKNMLKNNINEKLINQITEISQKELEEIKQM